MALTSLSAVRSCSALLRARPLSVGHRSVLGRGLSSVSAGMPAAPAQPAGVKLPDGTDSSHPQVAETCAVLHGWDADISTRWAAVDRLRRWVCADHSATGARLAAVSEASTELGAHVALTTPEISAAQQEQAVVAAKTERCAAPLYEPVEVLAGAMPGGIRVRYNELPPDQWESTWVGDVTLPVISRLHACLPAPLTAFFGDTVEGHPAGGELLTVTLSSHLERQGRWWLYRTTAQDAPQAPQLPQSFAVVDGRVPTEDLMQALLARRFVYGKGPAELHDAPYHLWAWATLFDPEWTERIRQRAHTDDPETVAIRVDNLTGWVILRRSGDPRQWPMIAGLTKWLVAGTDAADVPGTVLRDQLCEGPRPEAMAAFICSTPSLRWLV